MSSVIVFQRALTELRLFEKNNFQEFSMITAKEAEL